MCLLIPVMGCKKESIAYEADFVSVYETHSNKFFSYENLPDAYASYEGLDFPQQRVLSFLGEDISLSYTGLNIHSRSSEHYYEYSSADGGYTAGFLKNGEMICLTISDGFDEIVDGVTSRRHYRSLIKKLFRELNEKNVLDCDMEQETSTISNSNGKADIFLTFVESEDGDTALKYSFNFYRHVIDASPEDLYNLASIEFDYKEKQIVLTNFNHGLDELSNATVDYDELARAAKEYSMGLLDCDGYLIGEATVEPYTWSRFMGQLGFIFTVSVELTDRQTQEAHTAHTSVIVYVKPTE